jgi:cytolysin (calcineurin-like family phosphatase)
MNWHLKMNSYHRIQAKQRSRQSVFSRWCAAVLLWAAVAAPPLHAQAPSGKPTRDLTFFVVSDTHYGLSPEGNKTVPLLVDKMNSIPGLEYPAVIGGKVGTPRGVLHIGDCTNDGKKEQWEMFVKDYGLTGKDGRLKWPVYECYGNHDGGPKTPVREGIRERNKKRVGLTSISENGIHYCWNWDGVLFVNLGIAPGSTTRPYDPEYSMEYLEETLKQHAKHGQPLLLLHHFGFDKSHSLNWWPLERRTRYHDLIADRNVIGILHGHAHEPFIYQWKGIDVFHPPHFKQKDPKNGGPVSHGFFVFHVSGDELTVAERKLDDTWGMTLRKKIDPLAAKNNPITTKPGTPEP